MLVQVYLGYERGVRRSNAHWGAGVYGQLVSERVRGLDVAHLWPYDFALNTRASTDVLPLHSLWRPQFSGFLATEFGVSGLERFDTRDGPQWVMQRWLCMPVSLERIRDELARDELRRPREIAPTVR